MLPYTAVDLIHTITADLVPEGEPDPDRAPATQRRRTLAATLAARYRRIRVAR